MIKIALPMISKLIQKDNFIKLIIKYKQAKNLKRDFMIAENTNISQGDRSSIYNLPKFLSQIEHITTVDTGGLEFVICCDRMKLYIFPLLQGINKPLGSIHQSLPIPNIKTLKTVAKNFLLIQTQNKYLGMFEIIKSTVKQVPSEKTVNPLQTNTVKVQFSQVLKWRIFSSYFIREVMQNLFEVQVFFTDVQFEIFQFTNKNKRGSMSFTISPNGKILKCSKKQLYGSKCFFNIGRKLIYWLKNFSDKQFLLQEIAQQQPMGANKILAEPFGYFGVQRAQEYKALYANFLVRDCLNPAKRHLLEIQKDSFLNELKAEIISLAPSRKRPAIQQNPFHDLVQKSSASSNINQILQSYKISTFTDLLMIQNKQSKLVEIYQIRAEGSSIIGKQDSRVSAIQDSKDTSGHEEDKMDELKRWEWFFGNTRKLIAIDKVGLRLKYVQEITLQQKNQNKISAEIINSDEKKQNISIPTQTSQPSKPESEEKKEIKREINTQVIVEQKRKFSKDELQKYCEKFNDKDALKLVDQQLIKKVEQIKKNLQIQEGLANPQSTQNSEKSPIPTQKAQTQAKDIKKQQKQSKEEKPTDKILKKAEKSEVIPGGQPNVKQNTLGSVTQTINLKQKPPMKIIQRNKISVAKTFSSQAGLEQNTKIDNKTQQKVQSNVLIQQSQQKKENQSKIPNLEQQQTQKKEVKNITEQNKQKQIPQPQAQSNGLSKEEKKRVNVITRDTLLKKKEEVVKEAQNQPVHQSKEEIQKKSISGAQNVNKIQQSKSQMKAETLKEEIKLESIKSDPQTQIQPKTRFIPSIDVNKVSANRLNNCDFLSQDSLSDEQKQPIKEKQTDQKVQYNEEQSIEQQIQADVNASSSEEQDLEHLIDDDIGQKDTKIPSEAARIETSKNVIVNQPHKKQKSEASSIIAQSLQQPVKVDPSHQLIHDEEIQKFCNTLLQEQPSTDLPKQSSAYSTSRRQNSPTKKIQIITLQSKGITISQNDIALASQNKFQPNIQDIKKQEIIQTNQFNNLPSLLFKTSIKRTNIFGSQTQDQNEAKQQTEQKIQSHEDNQPKNGDQFLSKDNDKDIELKTDKLPEKSQIRITFGKDIQSSNTNQQEPRKQKKPKIWHEVSSDSNNEESLTQQQLLSQENKKQELDKQTDQEKLRQNKQAPMIQQIAPQIKQSPQSESIGQTVATSKIPFEKTGVPEQKTVEQKQPKKNPFLQFTKPQKDFNIFNGSTPILNGSSPIFPSPNHLFSSASSIFPSNSSAHWLSSRPPADIIQNKDHNPFINFKKNFQEYQQHPHPNAFGLTVQNLTNSSNSNLFKKILSERENKTQTNKEEQRVNVSSQNIKIEKIETKEIQSAKIDQKKTVEISKETQPAEREQTPSKQKFMPTSVLPEIQQLISKYEKSTLELLEKQQKSIIKSLEQIPHTHNPYNKNHSLLLPEQIKEQIIKQSKNAVKKWLSSRMLDKIETSFRQIMQQHKNVYEEALKYYEAEAKRKISTMQLQYEQQSTILTDIENVSANMCAALQSSILQGEQLHAFQLKEWKKEIQLKQSTLIEPLIQRIDDQKILFESRNKNLENTSNELKEIKEILKEKLRKKQELKEIKEKEKLKNEQKIKQKKQQKISKQNKIKVDQKKKKSTKRTPVESQNPPSQFYGSSNYRQNEAPYYGRPPQYQYY